MPPEIAIPRGSLVVSCQARPDNPLHGPGFMAAMARAAVQGGASAIRANSPADIAAIRAAVDVPIIGIWKREGLGWPVLITPDIASATAVVEAGADIVALDATDRPRGGEPLATLIAHIRDVLGRSVMADVATFAEGMQAARLGADIVASTLSGYTGQGRAPEEPDFDLVRRLAAACPDVPVIAEGRYATPADTARAFDCGAYAVVVGTAITNPREITRRFAAAAPWRG